MTSKVVGEGTFGCVLKPPLLCDSKSTLTKKDYNNRISKIMYSKHAINEEKEYSSINNIVGISENWMYCPRNKNFECSKEISFEMVKEKIDQCIKDLNK